MTLRVLPSCVEDVTDALAEITGTGTAIEPAIAALGPDEGYKLDAASPVTVKGYLFGVAPQARRRAVRRALVRRGAGDAIVGRLGWKTIREEDWAESWKQHYDIERVGRIVIRPAWREYAARAGEAVVALDPGMAFGTGQHSTTRMCLAALQERLRPGDRVLDLGTGSGILALAAAALGARHCLALDIEEQAIAAARANVALNGAQNVEVRMGSLEAATDQAAFDLVLANINAATVTALAGELAAVLERGGLIVAGGIIADRLAGCAEALTGAGLVIEREAVEDSPWRADGDWRALIARKPLGR